MLTGVGISYFPSEHRFLRLVPTIKNLPLRGAGGEVTVLVPSAEIKQDEPELVLFVTTGDRTYCAVAA